MALNPTIIAHFRKMVEHGLWTQQQYEEATHLPPAEHMGAIAAFLCSDEASHINGCIFTAAGHKLACWSAEMEKVIFPRDWQKQGGWTWEEVKRCMPSLLKDYVNPAPPDRGRLAAVDVNSKRRPPKSAKPHKAWSRALVSLEGGSNGRVTRL